MPQESGRFTTTEIELPNGEIMLARVRRDEHAGPADVGLIDRLPSFSDVTATLEGIGCELARAWQAVRPDKAKVEFGIDFSLKAGKLVGLFVEGDAGASMTITLEWETGTPGQTRVGYRRG